MVPQPGRIVRVFSSVLVVGVATAVMAGTAKKYPRVVVYRTCTCRPWISAYFVRLFVNVIHIAKIRLAQDRHQVTLVAFECKALGMPHGVGITTVGSPFFKNLTNHLQEQNGS